MGKAHHFSGDGECSRSLRITSGGRCTPPCGMEFQEPGLESYDFIICGFSGGKDSLACLLHLLERGVGKERLILAHHEVDGREAPALMDWPSVPAYCRAVADHLGVRLISSWKVGGFEREMLRNDAPTAATRFETLSGVTMEAGGKSKNHGTRLKLPQTAASLSCRWCSAYLKIDVFDRVLVNSPEFQSKRILVVTGERAVESANRARYAEFEPGRAHSPRLGRHVDHWRPVHSWSTSQVWSIIQRHGIVPHAAYFLGWGRLSCLTCIFASANQWATIRHIAPARFAKIAAFEERFGVTINRKLGVRDLAARGVPYQAAVNNPDLVLDALGSEWTRAVHTDPASWQRPAGAYGENVGPS